MKSLSRQQLERRKAQAVRFTRDIREDDDRADEIEDESLEDYAQGRHIKLANPKGARKMPVLTRRELQDRIQELEAENEDLQSRLDEISDIVTGNGRKTERRRDRGNEPRARCAARHGESQHTKSPTVLSVTALTRRTAARPTSPVCRCVARLDFW